MLPRHISAPRAVAEANRRFNVAFVAIAPIMVKLPLPQAFSPDWLRFNPFGLRRLGLALSLGGCLMGSSLLQDSRSWAQTAPLRPNEPPDLSVPATDPPTGDTLPLQPTAPVNEPPILAPGRLERLLNPGAAASPEAFSDYRLSPGDSIFVSVQRFPDLSFQATLDIQGNVIVPIEGAVSLSGLSLDQAQDKIFQIYNQYVVNPDVTLTLTSRRPVQVTIVGEVTRPGFYPLQAPQISTALLTAGGSTQEADLRSVQIQRTLSNGEVVEDTIDLFTPLKNGNAIPDVELQNGDVIRVPRLDPGLLDEYDRALVASSTLAKPEIAVRVLNYASGTRGTQANLGTISLRNGSRFVDALTQVNVNPDRTDMSSIALVRFNPESGQAETLTVDANAALNGDITENIPLQDNDVLILDRNLVARITYSLDTFTQPFRDILGFLLFFDSISDAATDLFGP